MNETGPDREATPAENAISYLDELRFRLNEVRKQAGDAVAQAESELSNALKALETAMIPPEDRNAQAVSAYPPRPV